MPVFVPVSYSNGEKKIIGSTVLFPSTISEMTQYVVKNDCRYLETKTEAVNGVDMLFCSVSLNSEDLIAPAVNVFKKKVNEQTVLVGTVKRALLPNLESAITSNLTSDTYSFVEVCCTSPTGGGVCPAEVLSIRLFSPYIKMKILFQPITLSITYHRPI